MNDTRDHETMLDDAKGLEAEAHEREGYNRAVRDCLKLVAKWFWARAPETKSCRDEMQKLIKA